jgi:hypothetical protein
LLHASDVPAGLVALGQLGVGIAFAVVFLMWVYRLSQQLHARSGAYMAYSPAWAVGWYFVPVASLFKPFQAMRELWVISYRSTSQRAEPLLAWWWGFWIASGILGNVAGRLGQVAAASGLTPLVSTVATLLGDAASLGAGIALLLVLKGIADAYLSNFGDLAAPAQTPPGAEVARVSPAGWNPDPMGRHQSRYWDGSVWTHWVSDDGAQAIDPLN